MRKSQRDELIENGHFAQLRGFNDESIAGIAERESKGTLVNRAYAYATAMRDHLANGCIALLLGESDADARKSFEASVDYALKLIGAPPKIGGGVRIYEAGVELSEEGSRLTSLHEKKPQPGQEKLTITNYHRALISVACFGTVSEMRLVASVPEDSYRNPDVVAPDDYWATVRAWKGLMCGDEDTSHREAQTAVTKGSGSGKAEAAALLALIDRDQARFHRSLDEAVKHYTKATSKQQNDPLTSVFFPGLMLSRFALDRGMAVSDGPYLPVRLLSNYSASAQ